VIDDTCTYQVWTMGAGWGKGEGVDVCVVYLSPVQALKDGCSSGKIHKYRIRTITSATFCTISFKYVTTCLMVVIIVSHWR